LEEKPMKDVKGTENSGGHTVEGRGNGDSYHSVEFSITGIELPYQFKIWNTANMSMCVLVKEDSAILPRLKVGDTLDMKFYSGKSDYPTNSIKTSIRHISKDEGRFRGHYLVALEILENSSQHEVH
jgi:hypothetical protein